jgi:hypothetical protein
MFFPIVDQDSLEVKYFRMETREKSFVKECNKASSSEGNKTKKE